MQQNIHIAYSMIPPRNVATLGVYAPIPNSIVPQKKLIRANITGNNFIFISYYSIGYTFIYLAFLPNNGRCGEW